MNLKTYTITCPYCFHKMQDDEVLFRSELVNHGENNIIPDDYDDIEDYKARYSGPDKEETLRRYKNWDFFVPREDAVYEEFWKKFNGTTEDNPADNYFKVKAYHRKVLDPMKAEHQQYIRRQPDGTGFIRDEHGMVSQIELWNGERCNRRVCRNCHNPLPDNYGKHPVKFATIIGITGAGKTVYLSQLLKKMSTYAVKVGLSAIVKNPGIRQFVDNNEVEAGKSLPSSTPATRLQQPLTYEMVKAQGNERITETFVLYDVAGEVFKDSNLVYRFAPFIEHADAAIVLIDPMQFSVISEIDRAATQLDDPTTVLQTIHNIVSRGDINEKCNIPFAICLSKADTKEVQSALPDNMRSVLLQDIVGIKDSRGNFDTIFNVKDYMGIAGDLGTFIQNHEPVLAQMLRTNYSSYAYFAFTALGCDVMEKMENGAMIQFPVGPVLPKRIEEPLYWMFYKLGYIRRNAHLPGEIYCPECDSNDNYELPETERVIKDVKWLFVSKERYVNRHCKCCGHKWDDREGAKA